jgi:hypothetical protein
METKAEKNDPFRFHGSGASFPVRFHVSRGKGSLVCRSFPVRFPSFPVSWLNRGNEKRREISAQPRRGVSPKRRGSWHDKSAAALPGSQEFSGAKRTLPATTHNKKTDN